MQFKLTDSLFLNQICPDPRKLQLNSDTAGPSPHANHCMEGEGAKPLLQTQLLLIAERKELGSYAVCHANAPYQRGSQWWRFQWKPAPVFQHRTSVGGVPEPPRSRCPAERSTSLATLVFLSSSTAALLQRVCSLKFPPTTILPWEIEVSPKSFSAPKFCRTLNQL